jgi:hypothetical protein
MIAIVTILTAFPLGFFLRSRTSAVVAYIALYGWAFTYQGVYLMLMSLHHDANPAFEVGQFPWSYGVVTLAIYTAGMGLVFLGHRLGAGRRARRTPVVAGSSTGSSAGEVVAA